MGLCSSRPKDSTCSVQCPTSYKNTKPLAKRKEETAMAKARFPAKVPVIIERHSKEAHLPLAAQNKFLIPKQVTTYQLATVLRNRLNLRPGQTLHFLINGRTLAEPRTAIITLYEQHGDEDGFLYLAYTSQESLG